MDSRQMEEPMLFGLSQFTTGDLPFEEFLRLVQVCQVKSVEIAESKLSPIEGRARDQILELTESGITVSGVVPRVHARSFRTGLLRDANHIRRDWPDGPATDQSPNIERGTSRGSRAS